MTRLGRVSSIVSERTEHATTRMQDSSPYPSTTDTGSGAAASSGNDAAGDSGAMGGAVVYWLSVLYKYASARPCCS